MDALRERAKDADFPQVVLAHLGKPEEGERFLESRWPEARAVSDPDEVLYEALGLRNGSLSQLLGPRVFLSGLLAAAGGNGIGKPVGNPMRMSGWFLIDRDEVLWSHVHEYAGAPARWGELNEAVRDFRASIR